MTKRIGDQRVFSKVLDFTCQDYVTREVLFQVKYAQDVSISSEYEKLEIKGGSDNEVQFTSYHSPVSSFSAQLPLIDANILQAKTGAIKKVGAQLNSHDKIYTANASGKITLDVSPLPNTLKLYNTNSDGDLLEEITVGTPTTEEGKYSIADKEVTLHTSKKSKLILAVCDYTTGANAEGLQFISGKLPKLLRITAKTKVEDKAGNAAVQTIIIDKAKSDPTFSFETSAGNASVMPFECEVFGWVNEDGETQFFRMVTDMDTEV